MNKKEIITDYILENIRKGIWKPGKRILSEADIAKYNNVSRNTVREAILSLVDKNILEHRRGSGTYVKLNNKKHIVILYEDFFLKEIIGSTYRYIIENIKTKFDRINYIPILVETGKEKEYLNTDIDQISAIVKMTQLSSSLDSMAIENNIPIIEFGDDNTCFSSVKEDTLLQFVFIKQLIEKYQFKNIVIFNKNYNNMQNIGVSIHILYNYYFKSMGYTIFSIKDTFDLEDAPAVIHKGLSSLTTPPDVIIFLDDNIYKCGYEIYPLFDRLLTQTKIITFSYGKEKYNPNYKICKIVTDLDEISHQIYNLVLNNINNDTKTIKNVIVKPKITDEDKLK